MTIIKCDRCQKVCNHPYSVTISGVYYVRSTGEEVKYDHKFDLCGDCAKETLEYCGWEYVADKVMTE